MNTTISPNDLIPGVTHPSTMDEVLYYGKHTIRGAIRTWRKQAEEENVWIKRLQGWIDSHPSENDPYFGIIRFFVSLLDPEHTFTLKRMMTTLTEEKEKHLVQKRALDGRMELLLSIEDQAKEKPVLAHLRPSNWFKEYTYVSCLVSGLFGAPEYFGHDVKWVEAYIEDLAHPHYGVSGLLLRFLPLPVLHQHLVTYNTSTWGWMKGEKGIFLPNDQRVMLQWEKEYFLRDFEFAKAWINPVSLGLEHFLRAVIPGKQVILEELNHLIQETPAWVPGSAPQIALPSQTGTYVNVSYQLLERRYLAIFVSSYFPFQTGDFRFVLVDPTTNKVLQFGQKEHLTSTMFSVNPDLPFKVFLEENLPFLNQYNPLQKPPTSPSAAPSPRRRGRPPKKRA